MEAAAATALAEEFIARAAANTQLHGHSGRCRKGGQRGDDDDCAMKMPSGTNQHTCLMGDTGLVLPRCDHGMLVPFTPALTLAHPCNHMIVPACNMTRMRTLQRRAEAAKQPIPPLLTLEEASADAAEYACKYSCRPSQDAAATAAALFAARNTRAARSVGGDDETAISQGRRIMAQMLNAVNGSTVIPTTLAASFLLGHGESEFSHTTTPYNPYVLMRMWERQTGEPTFTLNDAVVAVTPIENAARLQFVTLATDYEHRPHGLWRPCPHTSLCQLL
jgi:hypothetical protein